MTWKIWTFTTMNTSMRRFRGTWSAVKLATGTKRFFAYRDACLVRGVCGRVRLLRVMSVLPMCARLLTKDFDQCDRADIERLLAALLAHKPAYTPQTLGTYKAILRRFFSWLKKPETFPSKELPPIVNWFSSYVPRRAKRLLDREELVTPAEIDLVLAQCDHPRDKALINLLWEAGARISEIGNLRVRQVSKVEHGYTLSLHGKTGQRTPLIIASAPKLTVWLRHHPFANNPDAPLWVYHRYLKQPKHTRYEALRMLLKRQFNRAGITKRIYPHLFRHSRSTYCVATGMLTDAQAKKYFGWTPDSDMLRHYTHLIDEDANNALLQHHGIQAAQTPRGPEVRSCLVCKELNQANAVLHEM